MDVKLLYAVAGTYFGVGLLTWWFGPAAPWVYTAIAAVLLVAGVIIDTLGNVGWRWRSPLYRLSGFEGAPLSERMRRPR